MEFCIREALVAVLEINDFKRRGFIACEIFFINHNSYMNEMHQHTDCVAFEGVRVELLVLEGVREELIILEGVRTARLFMIETRAVIYDRNVHRPNRYLATRRKEIIDSVIVAR